jgi:Flp pilus assembly protein TadD
MWRQPLAEYASLITVRLPRALGRYAEAVASYDCVIAINPDDADAWYSRGQALRCLGRLEEAEASHDKAVAMDPGCRAIHGYGYTPKKNSG